MSPRTPKSPQVADNRKKERGVLHINSSSDCLPLLQVTQSDTIETVCANGRHTAENDQSTWSSKREVSFVFYVFESASWWHIPVNPSQPTFPSRRRGRMIS